VKALPGLDIPQGVLGQDRGAPTGEQICGAPAGNGDHAKERCEDSCGNGVPEVIHRAEGEGSYKDSNDASAEAGVLCHRALSADFAGLRHA